MQTYDLLVTIDQEGDPILTGVSPAGEEHMGKLRTVLAPGDEVVISCTYEEFMHLTPRNLVVGIVTSGTGEVQILCPPLLH